MPAQPAVERNVNGLTVLTANSLNLSPGVIGRASLARLSGGAKLSNMFLCRSGGWGFGASGGGVVCADADVTTARHRDRARPSDFTMILLRGVLRVHVSCAGGNGDVRF